jgi:hypothetical protein
MSEENMSALPWKWFGPMYGTYWTEIYDVSSNRRLIQIQGRFRGDDLNEVQGKSYWYGGRFFVQPLEVSGMRHLLICDVDQAAKSSGVTEADAEVPVLRAKRYLNSSRSLYQLRLLEPELPQARITAFHDEPVFYPGTQTIESIRVTASVDIQVAGKYLLRLNLSGIQERTEGELGVGRGQLTVSFPAADLCHLGSGGPYSIDWTLLTRLVGDGEILAENRFASQYEAASIDARTHDYSLISRGPGCAPHSKTP